MSDSSINLENARAQMLSALFPITESRSIKVMEGQNALLANAINSPINVPPYCVSAMDGYAVCSELGDDQQLITEHFTVVGQSFAGAPSAAILTTGEAVRIMTGAVVPQAAHSVVPQEIVQVRANQIRIPAKIRLGAHMRQIGEDIRQGEALYQRGQRIGAVDLALIASLGIDTIAVYRPLKIVVFSTGNELIAANQPLSNGKIYDSNRALLISKIRHMGAQCLDGGVIGDDPSAMLNTLARYRDCDVVVTSGGVSAGVADFVRPALSSIGEIHFWTLNIKPGRPFAFGHLRSEGAPRQTFFALPGNPVACWVVLTQLVEPALAKLAGADPIPSPALFQATLATPIKSSLGRREFIRARLHKEAGKLIATPLQQQGAANLKSLALADALIVIGEAVTDINRGEIVDFQPINRF